MIRVSADLSLSRCLATSRQRNEKCTDYPQTCQALGLGRLDKLI
jgi:hypothetical protein